MATRIVRLLADLVHTSGVGKRGGGDWGGLTDISDQSQHAVVRADANQQHKLAIRRLAPQSKDQETEHDGARGVDPPAQLATADGGEDTKPVDEQVVPVVLPEDAHLRVRVAQTPAVEEQRELCAEGNADGDDGGEMEAGGLLAVVVCGDVARGHDNEDQRDGAHQEAEEDVPGGLDARLSGGEAVGVDFVDGAMGEDQQEVGERVED